MYRWAPRRRRGERSGRDPARTASMSNHIMLYDIIIHLIIAYTNISYCIMLHHIIS